MTNQHIDKILDTLKEKFPNPYHSTGRQEYEYEKERKKMFAIKEFLKTSLEQSYELGREEVCDLVEQAFPEIRFKRMLAEKEARKVGK